MEQEMEKGRLGCPGGLSWSYDGTTSYQAIAGSARPEE
jgi:hypothetical protein